MSSPVVDSYLDELLAELPAMTPGEQAATAQASTGVSMPAASPGPEAAPQPGPRRGAEAAEAPDPGRMEAAAVAAPAPAPAPVAPAPVEPRPAAAANPVRPVPRTPAPPRPATGPAVRTPIQAEPPEAIARQAAPPTQRWLRVALGRDHYAFELLRVQEVVRMAPIVAMRGADHAVLGVMNLRGRIVPVFDLGRWLGGTDVQVGERARIVVVERDDELIGVLVADVEDVASLAREHIEPPLAGSDAGAIVGIARVGNVPTVLLDANALFE